jgi:hypothetical protein
MMPIVPMLVNASVIFDAVDIVKSKMIVTTDER